MDYTRVARTLVSGSEKVITPPTKREYIKTAAEIMTIPSVHVVQVVGFKHEEGIKQ